MLLKCYSEWLAAHSEEQVSKEFARVPPMGFEPMLERV